jgi:hypothetical protein
MKVVLLPYQAVIRMTKAHPLIIEKLALIHGFGAQLKIFIVIR